MTVTKVGIRELKSKLSQYLRLVKAGETVIVTEHGKSIGQIIPVQPTPEERLEMMIAAGQAEWNGQKPTPYQPAIRNRGDRQLSDLVIEDRE